MSSTVKVEEFPDPAFTLQRSPVPLTRHPIKPEKSRGFTNDELLGFISVFTAEQGYAPSFREMAKEVGCSTSTLHERLKRLRSAGRVSWIEGGTARTLKVVT